MACAHRNRDRLVPEAANLSMSAQACASIPAFMACSRCSALGLRARPIALESWKSKLEPLRAISTSAPRNAERLRVHFLLSGKNGLTASSGKRELDRQPCPRIELETCHGGDLLIPTWP